MHELGIVFSIINSVENVAKENNVKHVDVVELEIGEVSTIVNSYLEDCWKWACSKSELMNGAELKVEVIPAVTYCESCKGEYKTVEYGKICPYCQSEKTYLLSGNEIMIKEIEAR